MCEEFPKVSDKVTDSLLAKRAEDMKEQLPEEEHKMETKCEKVPNSARRVALLRYDLRWKLTLFCVQCCVDKMQRTVSCHHPREDTELFQHPQIPSCPVACGPLTFLQPWIYFWRHGVGFLERAGLCVDLPLGTCIGDAFTWLLPSGVWYVVSKKGNFVICVYHVCLPSLWGACGLSSELHVSGFKMCPK